MTSVGERNEFLAVAFQKAFLKDMEFELDM